MQTLRTTINPTEEITVDDREAADLDAFGLVLTGTRAHTDKGLTEAAIRQVTGESGAPKTTSTGNTDDGDSAGGDNDGGDAENEEG